MAKKTRNMGKSSGTQTVRIKMPVLGMFFVVLTIAAALIIGILFYMMGIT